MGYRVRFSVERGEFEVPPEEETVDRPFSGGRVVRGDYGYTDSIVIGSIIRDDRTGEIDSVHWLVDPNMTPEEVAKLPERLKHYVEEHT